MSDKRLHCTIDERDRGFWLLWGDPPVEQQHGIICCGDIELKPDGTLIVTAMSKRRMEMLLDIMRDVGEGMLPPPRMTRERTHVIDRRTGRQREVNADELERFDQSDQQFGRRTRKR